MRGHGSMPMMPMGNVEELKTRGLDRTVARRAWGLTRPYRRRLVAFAAIIVATSAAGVVPALLIREVINRAIPEGRTGLLVALFAAMIGIGLAVGAFSMVERWLSASIGEEFILDLRTMLYQHVQRMPIAFFTRTQTGSLITRLNNDVIGAQRALTGTLGGIVDNLIGVTVTLITMLALEWRVTLVAVALLPLFIIPARIVGRKLQTLSREAMALNAEMNSVMTERFHVAGALLVKLFGRVDEEVSGFHDKAGRVASIGVKQALTGRALFAALGFVGTLATGLVYLIGGFVVIDGGLDVGDVVALGLLVTQLYGPLAQLSNARVDLMTALVSFERVFEVIDLPVAITESPDATDLTDPEGHIVFDRVSFRYPAADDGALASLEGPRSEHGQSESDWILRDVTVDIPPGSMVALVGPSGAGKSTMSSLLSRLYDVTEGRILIDGHDIRDITLTSLAQNIGVVSQDAHLFHDSIAMNLRYAKPDATDDELAQAAAAAKIHTLIEQLPDGYDTIVGERGYRMSGGEKQRLSIARVLLKDPAIVVLDEATAHLDTTSERLVQAALADILKGRTSLVIAHRLSTVVNADLILVLDGGRIVERGTHAELLSQSGLYADLARTQTFSGAPATIEPTM